MNDRKPCIEQSQAYTAAFDYFNEKLFEGKLPRVMLYLTRNAKIIGGFFCQGKWKDDKGNTINEIAINCNCMDAGDVPKLMSFLIHEMIHHWQHEFGSPTRAGYHNQEFGEKSCELGLALLNEKKEVVNCGQSVATRLIDGGKAENAIIDMPEEFIFPWFADDIGSPDPQGPTIVIQGGSSNSAPAPAPPKSGNRQRYLCPVCGIKLWGKSGLRVMCTPCGQALIEGS